MKKEYAEGSFVDSCRHLAEITGGSIGKNVNTESFIPRFQGFTWYNRTFISGNFDNKPQTITACVSDYNITAEIEDKLSEFGFKKMTEQAGMVMDLASFEGITEKDVPSEISIGRIGSADIREWVAANSRGFGKGPEEIFYNAADDQDLYFYACRKDGKIIGTTLLYVCNGNAGIHEVSMFEEYRGNGYAKLLLKTALTQAKELGAEAASLQASVLGEPLYRSIGFENVSVIYSYINIPEH